MSTVITARAGAPQRDASDPQVSAWVSANAGSGKTHVLVNRVIRLLLSGCPPDRILCLTFTKAAASEMANRLFATLGRWALLDDATLADAIVELAGEAPEADDLARARRLFAAALETPGGLKIQTIHAFCESLLQRFPLEAGIAPGFEVLDERAAAEALAEVRADLLDRAARDPDGLLGQAVATLVGIVSEAGLGDLVADLIARRRQYAAVITGAEGLAGACARIRAALEVGAGDAAHAIVSQAGVLDDARREAYVRAHAALAAGAKTDVRLAATLADLLCASSPERCFELLCAVHLTGAMAPRARLMTKALVEADGDLHDWLCDEQETVAEAARRARAAELAEATEALLLLATHLIAGYEAAKAARGALDYDDLITRTGRLIEGSSAAWVLYKLDYGLEHMLVDEAQDTSPEQWQVVRALADEFFAGAGAAGHARPRTVFAVGDEKQSIYSFQGARPAEFAAMHDHFSRRVGAARQRFAKVALTVSFRSTATVLEAVDKVFAASPAADGVIAPGAGSVHEAVRRGQAGRIELWPTVVPDPELEQDAWDAPLDAAPPGSPRLRLAEQIAARIAGWLAPGAEPLTPRGRPVTPGDILVLVRRRDAFSDAMVRALKRRGIPVAGADRLVLTRHMAVLDLMALARFVLLPEDDLTLATVLKSPLLRRDDGGWIDDDDLFALAHGRRGSLWAALGEAAGGGSWRDAHARLERWARLARRVPPYEFFATVLGADAGRGGLLSRLGSEANDPIDEFQALALAYDRAHVPSLQGFLHWFEAAAVEIKRDMDHGRDEVRVMTVHGAKGLEANIVILPDTCTVPGGRHDPKVLFVGEDDDEGAGAPTPLWVRRRADDTPASEQARARLQAERLEEYHRLLYVAMTRARDRLYVAGYEGMRGRDEGCWYDLVASAVKPLAHEVTDETGAKVWRWEHPQEAEPGDRQGQGAAVVARAEPPDWARRPAPPEPPLMRPLAPSRLEAAEAGGGVVLSDLQAANSPLAALGDGRFRRGRLVHRLLQALPDLAPEARCAAAASYLDRHAGDLAQDVRTALVDEVMAIVEDDRFAALFAPGSRAEVPLTGVLDVTGPDGRPVVISGQVDRLAATADEVLLVDYKTNRPPPEDLAGVPVLYLRQMAAYRLAMAAVFPDRVVRCLLLWTDSPRLMELPAALLDTAFHSGPAAARSARQAP